ncbi:MAG: metal-dependent hydrolase [Planctomycetes bacterium]|nr:metal-dependent hydrolase [Planctomycetota bacterium]
MIKELTWLGHGSWSLRLGATVVLLDPFLDESPTSPVKAADVEAHYILVSHGHYDHIGDTVAIATRTGATVVANHEIAQWLATKQGLSTTIGMNLGGTISLPFGTVKMTPAWHSSQLPDGAYGGSPAGFLVRLEGTTVYFACDTGLFSDMELIGRGGVDLAVLPIGDHFTMGPEDSLEAVKLIRPKRVIPDHYNTWPPIQQDAAAWAQSVLETTESQPIVLEPGGTTVL